MNVNEFTKYLKELNIDISEENLRKFQVYSNLLKEYNKKFNLTSITEDKEIYLKHFYDSLCLFKVKKLFDNLTLLDIGTGAGFPGIPIAIVNPNIEVTLLESNAKKCGFLKIVKDALNLKNIKIINARAEDYTQKTREKFDIVTSRAVAHLQVLAELETPALKVNGYFLPLKSHITEELENSNKMLNNLNLKLEEVINYTLPIESSSRTILKIKKQHKTPDIYPRNSNKILKDLKG